MKTIVVGYDGTDASDLALERVAELAPLLKATVIVTSVQTPVIADDGLAGGRYGVPAPMVDVELQERLRLDRERALAHARTYLEDRGIASEVAAPVGPAVDELIEVADRHGADLIVVGTREPGRLERLFGGSVSQGVARRAHCDVLVVHPPEAAS
jgi:nucleotide-binding universal stress UspA family protein